MFDLHNAVWKNMVVIDLAYQGSTTSPKEKYVKERRTVAGTAKLPKGVGNPHPHPPVMLPTTAPSSSRGEIKC